jgi:hypothetical protein
MNKGGSYVYTQSFGPDRRITPTRGRPARERESDGQSSAVLPLIIMNSPHTFLAPMSGCVV